MQVLILIQTRSGAARTWGLFLRKRSSASASDNSFPQTQLGANHHDTEKQYRNQQPINP
jgi:hypothetical protein